MPTPALETVQDYINDVRVILLDQISPYRYKDPELLTAFNLALERGANLRPDLFLHKHKVEIPAFNAIDGQTVSIERRFRQAFVYATVAHALMRDQEDVQDARATTMMGQFEDMLIGVRLRPIQGGTPNQQGQRQ